MGRSIPALVPQPACPVCGASARRVIGRRGDRPIPELLRSATPTIVVDVLACRGCGHYYCDPLPVPETLERLYADASGYFAGDPGDRLAGALAFMQELRSVAGEEGRLLDIGSGEGHLLEAARQVGWEATGVEPTEQFVAAARAKGLDVHHGYLDTLETEQRYDVVTAMAVLEHVPDPVGFLTAARALMRPGGVLVAEVPNGRRPEAAVVDLAIRLRGARWTVRTAPLQSPFHLSEFSHRSLCTALDRAGFRVHRLDTYRGEVPYPVPPAARAVLRGIQWAGHRLGLGLNMIVWAKACEEEPPSTLPDP